jgi:hypothetical protein
VPGESPDREREMSLDLPDAEWWAEWSSLADELRGEFEVVEGLPEIKVPLRHWVVTIALRHEFGADTALMYGAPYRYHVAYVAAASLSLIVDGRAAPPDAHPRRLGSVRTGPFPALRAMSAWRSLVQYEPLRESVSELQGKFTLGVSSPWQWPWSRKQVPGSIFLETTGPEDASNLRAGYRVIRDVVVRLSELGFVSDERVQPLGA